MIKLIKFFQGYLSTLLGIGDDYYSNIASLLAFTSGLYKNNSYLEFLEVNDTEIFGVGVRIYKPVNKTNKQVGNGSDGQGLLPALIYFHGGGWTLGSIGELFFFTFIDCRQFIILCCNKLKIYRQTVQ